MIPENGNMTKLPVILQARMSSHRLPGKVLFNLNGKPMIFWQIQRILKCQNVSEVIVSTSTDKSDDILCDYLEKISVKYYRGHLTDVLDRFISLIDIHKISNFVRLTADSPLVSFQLLNQMIVFFFENNFEYLTNTMPPTYPDGFDIEIVSSNSLKKLASQIQDLSLREHVTLGFHKSIDKYRIFNFSNIRDLSHYRFTVDYSEDYEFMLRVFEEIKTREIQIEIDELIQIVETKKIQNPLGNAFRNIATKDLE